MNITRVRASFMLCFLALEWLGSASSHAQTVVRGPYLQQGTPSSMIVRWHTDSNVSSYLEYGTSLEKMSRVGEGRTQSREHEVHISSLKPQTRYYYRIMAKGGRVLVGGDGAHHFVTSPTGGDEPFRVWVIGDSGTSGLLPSGQDFRQVSVRDEFLKRYPVGSFQLFMMLGDNAYDIGTDAQYQQGVFIPYQEVLRSTVLWPTQGNHDYATNAYYPVFSLPERGEGGGVPSGTEYYYSFNYGNVHFISLNSEVNRPVFRDGMLSWLRQDLAENRSEWTVAFWHHPPYSKGSHNSDSPSASQGRLTWMRENVVPILEAGGIDLVLTGHSHSYERTPLINRHYGVSSTFSDKNIVASAQNQDGKDVYVKERAGRVPHSGTVYVGAGNGGQLHPGPLNHPAMVRSLNKLGSMSLSFDANVLEGMMIGADGAIEDTFSIRKDPRRPVDVKGVVATLERSGCVVTVAWTKGNQDSSYEVYRSTTVDGRGEMIGEVSAVHNSFKDSLKGVSAGVVTYSVRAENSAGLGPWGSGIQIVVPSTEKCK